MKKKVLATVMAVATLCTCAFAATGCSLPELPWGDKNSEAEAREEGSGVTVIGEGEATGNVKMTSVAIPVAAYAEYDVDPLSESAYQLTATILPNDVTNKTVDWAVAWKDANSTWAKGKTVTDYVTIAATSDGAVTATLSCKQAFGEQVIVTVTPRSNKEVNATATVDYVKRVTNVDVSISPTTLDFDSTFRYTLTPVYGVGTVTGTMEYKDFSVALNGGIQNEIKYQCGYSSSDSWGFKTAKLTVDQSAKTFTFGGGTAATLFYDKYGDRFETDFVSYKISPMAMSNEMKFNNAFSYAVVNESGPHATLSVGYTYSYNSAYSATGTAKLGVSFNTETFTIAAESVSLNGSTFAF